MSRAKRLGSALERRVVEKAQAKGLDAHLQPLSGALKAYPGDAVIDRVLVECKVRAASVDGKGQRYLRLDLDFLEKVKKQAAGVQMDGAVLVYNATGSRCPVVILDLDFFLNLLGVNTSTEDTSF